MTDSTVKRFRLLTDVRPRIDACDLCCCQTRKRWQAPTLELDRYEGEVSRRRGRVQRPIYLCCDLSMSVKGGFWRQSHRNLVHINLFVGGVKTTAETQS